MAILEYNEEASKKLLAVYTTPDVEAQRHQFVNAINLKPGDKVLDVGSGPGFFAKIMSEKVGQSGSIYGIDVSEFLLDVARSNTNENDQINYSYGDATDLQFPDKYFDIITCTQVLEYVKEVDKALNEFHRALRNGGKLALLDTDWDSIVWHSSNRERMNKILKAWEAHTSDPFLPRTLSDRMRRAGFQVTDRKIFTIYNPNYNEETYSNRMIDLIVPFVIDSEKISREEALSWANDLRDDIGDNYFFSLNRYFFLAHKI